MTPEEKEVLCAFYRTDLSKFIQRTVSIVDPNADYLHNWHIDLIAEYLQACRRGEITRLVINIPPRFLKSISVSVAFPAWLLGHNPSEQVICVSYSHALAKKHSNDTRAVMQTDLYHSMFPQTILDKTNETLLSTTKQGYRYCTSTLGTITGTGANMIIVDDPLSASQAQSMVEESKGK